MNYETQEEYLMLLAEELKYLKPKDQQQVLDYYFTRISNAIDNGEKEIDVIKHLPTPEEAAESAYKSHGEKYVAARRRHLNFKAKLNSVVDCVISLLMVALFIFISIFFVKLFIQEIKMTSAFFSLSPILDKLLCGFTGVFYLVISIIIYLYFFDLMFFIASFFLIRGLNLSDTAFSKKIGTFTLNGFINIKTKTKKFNLKVMLACLGLIFCFVLGSYFSKGYCYRSLNNEAINKEIIELKENSLSISGSKYIVNIYNSDHNYLEYVHEFNHELVILDNELKVPTDTIYDFLDILSEPVQIFNLYVTEDFNLEVTSSQVAVVSSSDVALNNLNLNGLSITSNLNNVKINNLDVDLVKTTLNVTSNNDENNDINNINLKVSQNGSVTLDKIKVDNFIMDNHSAKLSLSNLEINNLEVKNVAGACTMNNSSVHKMNYEVSNAQTYLENDEIENLNINSIQVSNLNITDSLVSLIDAKLRNNSYLNIYSLKNNNQIKVDSEFSYIFINDSKSEEINISNKGDIEKTEITKSATSKLVIEQDGGFINLDNVETYGGTLNVSSAQAVELKFLSGKSIDLRLSMIGQKSNGYTHIIQSEDSTFEFVLSYCDLYSMASLIKDGNVNIVEPETGEDHE